MSKLYLLFAISMIGLTFQTICRDGSSCPGTSTCCLTPYGVGCCPYTNAVCCSDGLHCCPNGYVCMNDNCRRASANLFLSYVADSEKLEDLTKSEPKVEGTPKIEDIFKCIGDLKPFIEDIQSAVELYKKGDKQAILDLLTKIVGDGVTLGKDCQKVIQEIIS